ncbi:MULTISPECIES: hypothetical protein [Leptospira]|uniref:Uncharacterized protein n=4 Tax=Leptospira weilii TaxID=28184 RepID=A0A828Z6T6_9LEPT|nr:MULTISPECIES: hypothetical protein [Leptospira]EMM74931.1 hypothetical protein LEP1GSC038_0870 [Leptospira weilii str. 2006001855]EMY12267.1 hypothetical protein LEP1GSC043_3669 [Leptospira weilii str. Ecochallenge]EKR65980.1 hypothetical protein LEP1GSC036_0721 [Leptospira weilii str. 2006001853]EMJ61713.1 hypothetical protein LEP1GSC051_1358 [Leptospira sp. P2653]EMN46582.1 hypothetical protein LEP1GSC086_4119 [Leptospira weilii str. LNT 1234]
MRPKAVIQIFKSRLILSKGDRGFQNRPIVTWPDRLESTTAKIENQSIHYFGSDLSNNKSFSDSDFLVILDYNPSTKISENSLYDDRDEITFNDSKANKFKFDIFEFEKINSNELKLYFNGKNIGVPKRQRFQIANLKPNLQVRVRINWKNDFSFSRGIERRFYELDYIVEFKGIFETFLNERAKDQTFPKYLQVSNCKEVDLRKILN